jgi:hypothetical protein
MFQRGFHFIASAVLFTALANAQLAENPALKASGTAPPTAPVGPPPPVANLTLYTDHTLWHTAAGGSTTLIDFESFASGTQITTQLSQYGITGLSGTSIVESPPGPTTQFVTSSQALPFPMFSAGLLPSETMFLSNRLGPGVYATGELTFAFAGPVGAVGAYVADNGPINGFFIDLFDASGILGSVMVPTPGLSLPNSFIGVTCDVPFTSATFRAESPYDSWGLDNVEFSGSSPGSGFCFGDGTGTACPCGNAGVAGHGCASSVNTSGAVLAGSGAPSIGSDSFVLTGSGMPNSSALYFQGGSQAGGGTGLAFGDGLRCAGNPVIRLGTKLNVGGTSSYPSGGDAHISVKGANSAGFVRTYQVWYRNAAPFCTPSTFNLSNGFETTWVP